MNHEYLLIELQDIADELKAAKTWREIERLGDRVQALKDKLDD